jgi:hypothetical protein
VKKEEPETCAMQAIFSLLVVPIAILNFGGGIVGAIWLAVLGQWSLIGIGLAATIFSTMLLGIVLMPGLIFAAPAAVAFDKGHYVVGILLGAISALWTYIVIVVWCVLAFGFIVDQHHGGAILPYLLWAYSVSTGPWTYMAQHEARADPNSFSPLTAFFACIGAAAMMAIYLFMSRPTLVSAGIAFIITMTISFVFQLTALLLMAIVDRRHA